MSSDNQHFQKTKVSKYIMMSTSDTIQHIYLYIYINNPFARLTQHIPLFFLHSDFSLLNCIPDYLPSTSHKMKHGQTNKMKRCQTNEF